MEENPYRLSGKMERVWVGMRALLFILRRSPLRFTRVTDDPIRILPDTSTKI
jgi:hypothetical protein